MKRFRRCTRIFILCLLAVSVFAPIVLLSGRLKQLHSAESKEYIEDLSSIKYRTDALKLNAIEQEEGEALKEPPLLVYKVGDFKSTVSFSSSDERIMKNDESRNATKSGNFLDIIETNHDTEEDNQQSQLEKGLSTSQEKV
ncbi:unnamed protein product [Ilex paraguariensis]|uniref:Uncharacterized protein n=1 Tax=Ilex paraguariensis TaxID=185542 RepID=A0ABC8RJQ7_9AQUA